MERSRRIRYRDYWARRAFGSRVIFDLSCVSIATVMDLMVYAACSPVRRRPASDLITFGNKSIPEMPVHGHDPQSIPEVWVSPLPLMQLSVGFWSFKALATAYEGEGRLLLADR